MIEIRPTTASGLSHDAFLVTIPGEINPQNERPQKITTTLSGKAAITSWAKNNSGAQQSVSVTIPEASWKKLSAITNHQTVFEWLVFCDGRRYDCTIDTDTPVSVTVFGGFYKQVNVKFTVVEDYND